jgi:hypothetical protein
LLKWFISEDKLLQYKPIHLCWWFLKHGYEVPKYFIAGMPEPPAVTTNAVSNVEHDRATGNGNITSTGTEAVTERGFCYLQGASGDPTTADSTVSESSAGFSTGAYSLNISGLTESTAYRVRAYAINSVGTGYGATVDLTTTASSSSLSPSASPSQSPSSSLSASISLSLSPSVSPTLSSSLSPSASPGWELYTRGDEAALPTDDTDLETTYSSGEITNVSSSNDTRVSQTATGEYAIHMFKVYTELSSATVTCEVQTDFSPATSNVLLQVYNYDTPGWETLDTYSTDTTGTDFTLSGNVADTTNYLNGGVMTCRVYQLSQ